MKVLSFGNIPSWAGGRNDNGLSNVIYQLAVNMAKVDGIEMTLVATDVNKPVVSKNGLEIIGWTRDSLLKYSIKSPFKTIYYLFYAIFFKIRYHRPEDLLSVVFKMLHLNRAVKFKNPDIVHLHGAASIIYLKAIPSNTNTVLTIHGILGNDRHFDGYCEYAKLEKACCVSKRLKKLYFISKKLIDDYKGVYNTIIPPVEAINNAYDNKVFYYQERDKNHKDIKLLTVATLSHIKGQERVLQALKKTKLDYHYECIGGDSDGLACKLKSFAQKEGICYRYHGKKTPQEISKMLADSDFMILPSSTEGFGLVFLEAIACGVPVVLPQNLPIVQEADIIKPGINAVLIKDYSVESIAGILPELRKMSFDRQEVSNTVAAINWLNIAKKYADSFINL